MLNISDMNEQNGGLNNKIAYKVVAVKHGLSLPFLNYLVKKLPCASFDRKDVVRNCIEY